MKKFLLLTIPLLFAVLQASAQQDSISKDISLGNVTVEGSRPLVKTVGSKQTITVKGSFLTRGTWRKQARMRNLRFVRVCTTSW